MVLVATSEHSVVDSTFVLWNLHRENLIEVFQSRDPELPEHL